MPLHVLIAPDKFKGTLTAQAAAEAMADGWISVRSEDQLELLPISDGGDGFGEILSGITGATVEKTATVDSAGRPHNAQWWWDPATKTAIIETAKIIGLALLPPGKFHPFELDTFGIGKVFSAARERGARACIIGIGGSSTNDGGFGLARALGWEFLDRAGNRIEQWTNLQSLAAIRPPRKRRLFDKVIVAVDVQNRLLGARGCTRIYGPQKGLRPEDFAAAEKCLRRLASVAERDLGSRAAKEAGAGAAGGLGFGLRCFLNARLEPGFEIVARRSGLSSRLKRADLVITGEGAIDRSSLMGKGVGELADACARLRIPCIGLAGMVEADALARRKFLFAEGIVPGLATLEQAKSQPAKWLSRLAAKAARQYTEVSD